MVSPSAETGRWGIAKIRSNWRHKKYKLSVMNQGLTVSHLVWNADQVDGDVARLDLLVKLKMVATSSVSNRPFCSD